MLSLKTLLARNLFLVPVALFAVACAPADNTNLVDYDSAGDNTYNFATSSEFGEVTEVSRLARTIAPTPDKKYSDNTSLGKSAYLGNDELVKLFIDRTVYGAYNDQTGDWAEFTAKNGRTLFLNNKGEIRDGSWWVKSNQVCFSYDQSSDEFCYRVARKGQGYQYINADGSQEFYITEYEKGDTADLTTRFLVRD